MEANGENVKLQKQDIEKLNVDIDAHNEEICYLRNKVEYKINLIDDLQHDIEKKDEEVSNISDALELNKVRGFREVFD